jgi:eukaryotic-like serine/threonine-protein kinase
VGRLGEPDFPTLAGDPGGADESGLTMQGQMIGTPGYMAPEQASGRLDQIDRHTDIYGLGAILYEILTGNPPFMGFHAQEVLLKVQKDQPRRVREIWPDVPSALENICLRALAKNPADRFASASELAQEVQGWQDRERREAEEARDRFFTLSLDMLCIAGFDGYFKRLNPAWERTLGFTIEEMLAEPFVSFVHPDDRERTGAETQRLSTGAEILTFENRYRCKDGSYKWLQWTAIPFVSSQSIYAAAREITARKQTEDALRKARSATSRPLLRCRAEWSSSTPTGESELATPALSESSDCRPTRSPAAQPWIPVGTRSTRMALPFLPKRSRSPLRYAPVNLAPTWSWASTSRTAS